MRIGVVGAGAMGGTLAALLHQAGHEIEVAARGVNLRRIRERGLRLEGERGEHTAAVSAAEALGSVPELAIVATKAQDAAEGIRQNLDALDGIPLVIVQNGLDGVRTARATSPGSGIVGALAVFPARYLEPGVVTVTSAHGGIVLGIDSAADGAAAERDSAALELAADALGPVIEITRVDGNFEGALWSKLLVNHVNALPAITGLSIQEVSAEPALRLVLTASIRESVRIARRLGIRFEPMHGLDDSVLGFVGRAPLWLGQRVPREMGERMGPVPNLGSTLQSIRRGQPTEIGHLNGAVVDAARRIGREAPVNRELVDLVHEVERSGRFLSVAEVVARVDTPRRGR